MATNISKLTYLLNTLARDVLLVEYRPSQPNNSYLRACATFGQHKDGTQAIVLDASISTYVII